jgi:hypothetical protein
MFRRGAGKSFKWIGDTLDVWKYSASEKWQEGLAYAGAALMFICVGAFWLAASTLAGFASGVWVAGL